MNINPNVDLSLAFDRLKKGMNDAEDLRNDKSSDMLTNLASAYSVLYSYVAVVVAEVEQPVTKTSPS